ncbi:hypothetical protein FZW96_08040 [Bacillus sp. BGMRC 2118]|nr:hypothetical protein FZW96_08040 [Bacillus sp. BGMRC 2118]
MKINVSREIQLAREIGNYEQTLTNIQSKLDNYSSKLGVAWKATEIPYILDAINDVKKDIGKVAGQLSSIESTIISTARMIRQEEEQKEAEERAAREEALKKLREQQTMFNNMNP